MRFCPRFKNFIFYKNVRFSSNININLVFFKMCFLQGKKRYLPQCVFFFARFNSVSEYVNILRTMENVEPLALTLVYIVFTQTRYTVRIIRKFDAQNLNRNTIYKYFKLLYLEILASVYLNFYNVKRTIKEKLKGYRLKANHF